MIGERVGRGARCRRGGLPAICVLAAITGATAFWAGPTFAHGSVLLADSDEDHVEPRNPPPHRTPPHHVPPHTIPRHLNPPHRTPPHHAPPHTTPRHLNPPHRTPPHRTPPHHEPRDHLDRPASA